MEEKEREGYIRKRTLYWPHCQVHKMQIDIIQCRNNKSYIIKNVSTIDDFDNEEVYDYFVCKEHMEIIKERFPKWEIERFLTASTFDEDDLLEYTQDEIDDIEKYLAEEKESEYKGEIEKGVDLNSDFSSVREEVQAYLKKRQEQEKTNTGVK